MTITEAQMAEAAALVEEALFLRMYGERPPGAPEDSQRETWADWEKRAETWVRAQPAAQPLAAAMRPWFEGLELGVPGAGMRKPKPEPGYGAAEWDEEAQLADE
jgi:hypothetical protein